MIRIKRSKIKGESPRSLTPGILALDDYGSKMKVSIQSEGIAQVRSIVIDRNELEEALRNGARNQEGE